MKKHSLAIVALIFSISCISQKNDFKIGQKSITYTDISRNRPLLTEIWYPTYDSIYKNNTDEHRKELFKTIQTIPLASIPDKKFPLLLISHGTGGNRFSLTWFVEKMVKEGYIVAAIDHFGNSTFNKIPREFLKWWERAIDIQYVLTEIIDHQEIGNRIDISKIGGVGFSLGGYTHIALAGGYVDRNYKGTENKEENTRELPPEFPETKETIDFDTDSLIVSSYNKYKNQVKDDRIKAFFVMAPAIGFGFYSKKQTSEIIAPVFIIAGRGDKIEPVRYNAEKYHNLIKNSQIHLFDKKVGHYVFLNEPTQLGKKVIPEITIDLPEVSRKEIHEKTVKLAIDFFKQHL
ncbi:dienelactone hydrolase [Aquimarina sp. RZ0]|uniref:alpha/beta hydrolase family protein n=1 Tax=Aquimarina sp. RZ0 TaxID=2607730 RepID=UPI0011F3D1AA|nr:dienelactone hydrolase [Aquimarina sp. RZ0]KAA1243264.1 dienelactone hydrolase [Aquimarina sp. RZ0]